MHEMKKICDFCHHQGLGPNGNGIGCQKAVVEPGAPGYGYFKRGAMCLHDSDLSDHFSPRDGQNSTIIRDLASTIGALEENLMSLRHENATLKDRLIKI